MTVDDGQRREGRRGEGEEGSGHLHEVPGTGDVQQVTL